MYFLFGSKVKVSEVKILPHVASGWFYVLHVSVKNNINKLPCVFAGCKHVKGILLFGPPGCGKTLMARQIGKMLKAREPKIVNGPEILNKYVGESEANIRKLFADAEEEQKRVRKPAES